MNGQPWRPSASLENLRARAALNQQIREFFARRGVLEVETPLLSHAAGSDPNLQPIAAEYRAHADAAPLTLYLQTSPEFAMKRLLAAGSGPIYQLGKAFRNGELGRRHNPEFTMLEWYRPGFTLEALMDEVEALLHSVLDCAACRRISYRDLFLAELDIDPHLADATELAAVAARHLEPGFSTDDRDIWLDLLYGAVLEPRLQDPVFIHDYPPSQAALARIGNDDKGQAVARRFELVVAGMELANGYDELLDSAEQQQRFARDLQRREQRGLPLLPVDGRLLAALQQPLPSCAGVALGVDRLLMLQTGAQDIAEVLAFGHARA